MLSYETEEKICKMLMNINDNEKKCEITRNNLCQINNFNPYSIFNRIDNDCTNFLTEDNIINFLNSNSIYCTEKEIKTLIKFYDYDSSHSLNYNQFLNMIMGNENKNKRDSLHKLNDSIHLIKNLPYQIEYATCRIIEKEINFIRHLDSLIDELKTRKDFSICNMFCILNDNNEISYFSLKNLFNKHNINFNDDDINRILNKFDINKDNHVTFDDFQKIFGFDDCYTCCNYNKSINNNNDANYQNYIKENYRNINDNTNKNIYTYSNYSSKYNTNNNNLTYSYTDNVIEEQKNQNEIFNKRIISDNVNINQIPKNDYLSNLNNNNINNLNNIKLEYNKSQDLKNKNFEKIVQFLELLMDSELEIEKAKIELSLRADFNIKEAYKFFDSKHFDCLTLNDLKKGLTKLQLYVTDSDIQLLIKKYDLNNKGFIGYDDFFNMLVPYEREYRDIMEKKLPISNNCKFNEGFFLTDITLSLLRNLLNIIISSESKIEDERKIINKMYNLNIRKIFDEIDKKGCGYFGLMDLQYFFKKYEIPTINKEIDLLFIRLDRNRKGEVDLMTFLFEIIPRII